MSIFTLLRRNEDGKEKPLSLKATKLVVKFKNDPIKLEGQKRARLRNFF